MAYTGLTAQERAQVGDACVRMLADLALGADDQTWADRGRRGVDVAEVARQALERVLFDRLVEQRRTDRRWPQASWAQLAAEAGVSRQGFEKRWKAGVEAEAARRMAGPATTAPPEVQPVDIEAATAGAA